MNLIKIRLTAESKSCSVLTEIAELRVGDRLVISANDILALGTVTCVYADVDTEFMAGKLTTRIERPATPEDLTQEDKNRLLEQRAMEFCQKRIDARQLPFTWCGWSACSTPVRLFFILPRPAGWTSGNWSRTWCRNSAPASSCGRSACATGPRWWGGWAFAARYCAAPRF